MCHLKIVVTHTDRKPRAKTLHTPTCRGSSYFLLLRPDKDVLPGMEASLVGTERPQISEMVCVNTQRRANNSYHLPVVASLLHDLQERHLRRRSLLKLQAATHPPVTGLIIQPACVSIPALVLCVCLWGQQQLSSAFRAALVLTAGLFSGSRSSRG